MVEVEFGAFGHEPRGDPMAKAYMGLPELATAEACSRTEPAPCLPKTRGPARPMKQKRP